MTISYLVFLVCALSVFMFHNFLLVFSNRIYLKLVHTVNGPYDFNFKRFGDKGEITDLLLEAEIPKYLKRHNLAFKIPKYKREFDKKRFDENIGEFQKYVSDSSAIDLKKTSDLFSSLGRSLLCFNSRLLFD